MTAEEMFKELGFRPDPFNGVGNIFKYFYEIKYNSNARFIVDFDCNDDELLEILNVMCINRVLGGRKIQ